MSSFIGLVTQKDINTGVTLKAKVVTPSGKKYGYQDFKIMVKSSGMSDLTACILDLNSTTATLTEKGVSSITQNITSAMPNVGEHGTSIVYKYESAGSENILDYITIDGVIKKRPDYGAQVVSGNLVITVSKGDESVNSKMIIAISPYSIEEIFTNANALLTWDSIRGKNAIESNDNASGLRNVMYPLTLITKIPASSISGSAVDIDIAWSITDSLQEYAEAQGLYTGARINAISGAITRPDYTKAYNVYKNVGASYGVTVVSGSVPLIRMGGITLTAKLTINDSAVTSNKTFMLSTLSKYLMNSEVASWLSTNIKAKLDNGSLYAPMNTSSNVITLEETEDEHIKIVTIPKSATGFGTGGSIGLSSINADVTTTIVDYDTPTKAKIYDTAITNGPIVDEDAGISTVTFDLSKAGSLAEADKKFILNGNINVWAYSADGVVLGGEPSVSKAIWKFEMKTLSS